jgi:cleavage and polyadenylation specificity factor subunit 1
VQLELGLDREFVWNFVVADIATPILGADFIKQFHLLPDLTRNRFVDGKSLCSVSCSRKVVSQPSVHLVTKLNGIHARVLEILKSYPLITAPPRYQEKPLHDTMHYIHTTGKPIYQRPYRLPPKEVDEVKEEFRNSTKLGITEPSKSPWASPLVIVKKNGRKRFCGNYRRVNSQTVPDRYPIPFLSDSSNKLHNMNYFSKIDLVKAYFNIPIYPPHVEKTAIISPAGLYQYLQMPFGLKNAPSTFMRFITSILGDLPFIFIYIDDILLFSETEEEHLQYLNILFQRLNLYGLTINLEKSKFCSSSIDFLGHRILKNKIQPTDERVEYIKNLKKPKSVTALRRILGIFSFYRRFVRRAAELLAPFYDLLRGKMGKRDLTPINWTEDLEVAFQKLKSAFVNYTLLNFMKDDCELQLTCDASVNTVGGVLEQIVNGEAQPLAFYSEKLDSKKLHWSTYDKELYAIYACTMHFEYLIQGCNVTFVTDHKPLLSMFHRKAPIKLERRSRYIEYISQFSTSIKHVSGISNVVADAISRTEAAAVEEKLTLKNIAAEQQEDEEIRQMRETENSKLILRDIYFTEEACSVLCAVIQGKERIVLPKKFCYQIFEQLHGLSHPGGRPTIKLISNSYFWPRMQTEIRKWCRCCLRCQKSKISRHTVSELGQFPESDRFEHVHLDVFILPEVDGYGYLLTFIDRATRWIEAKPLKETKAEDVAKAFVEMWVSRHGTPHKLTSDRGPQF